MLLKRAAPYYETGVTSPTAPGAIKTRRLLKILFFIYCGREKDDEPRSSAKERTAKSP